MKLEQEKPHVYNVSELYSTMTEVPGLSYVTYPEIESEYDSVVKPSWYNAYTLGNSLWPQTGIGIEILSLDAVLNDLPDTGLELVSSSFTSDQLDSMGKLMSSHHHRRGIQKASHPYNHEEDTIIEIEKIQVLWRGMKDFVGNALINYRTDQKLTNTYFNQFSTIDMKSIEMVDHFFDTISDSDLQYLKEFVGVAKAPLFHEEGLALSKLHRLKYDRTLTADEIQIQSDSIREKYGFWHTSSAIQMQERVLMNLRKTYPDQPLRWLGIYSSQFV